MTDRSHAVVVGGCNVDVRARPHERLVPGTSNPGRTVTSPGGVGRNVAENLARLGTPTHLVSVVGEDVHGDVVLTAAVEAGVDVLRVRRGEQPTGTYVALLDETGEMVAAVSDMAATAELTPDDVAAAAHLLDDAGVLVLDGNLAPATLDAAWRAALDRGVPVVLDPVSTAKAARLASVVDAARPVRLLSAGREEVAVLGPVAALHRRGVELVWERLGADGAVLHAPGREPLHLSALDVEVADVTGAGDAMLAGWCHATLGGADPVEAACFGRAAAALTVQSPHTVRADLTADLVRSLV